MDNIRKQISESIRLKQEMLDDTGLINNIRIAGEMCVRALEKGKKIMIAGNGGSAADAQHMAAELVNRFQYDRPAAAALSLSTDTSIITAVANDYSFDRIFSRQVEALGNEGDILLLITTSGSSSNILKAAETARNMKVSVIGLIGHSGGKLKALCDLAIIIPSGETPRIQECQILAEHIICSIIENQLIPPRAG